jgi:uncharacterized membrane protein HdeD (DUF308 family)
MNNNNPARTTSRVWWIITAVFFVLMFFPFVVDGAPIGVIVFVFSLIIFITGIITALIYGGRAGKIDKFLKAEGTLVHWKYTPEEWMQYTEKEAGTDKGSKKTMFFVITGLVLLISIIYAINNPKSSTWIMITAAGLILIIGFTAWFTGWYNHRQNKKYPGEAYIARDGVYLNCQLHLWDHLGAYLDSVEYVEGAPPLLAFTYFSPTGTVVQIYKARVPVPMGQETKAKELLAVFNKDKEQKE